MADPLGASVILDSPSRKVKSSGRSNGSSEQRISAGTAGASLNRDSGREQAAATATATGLPIPSSLDDPLGLGHNARKQMSASAAGLPRPSAGDDWKQNLSRSYHPGNLQAPVLNQERRPLQKTGFLPPTPRGPLSQGGQTPVKEIRQQQSLDQKNGPTPRSPFGDEAAQAAFSERRESLQSPTASTSYQSQYSQQQTQQNNKPEPAPQQRTQRNNSNIDNALTAEALKERDLKQGVVKIRMLGVDRARKELWLKLEASSNLSTYQHSHLKPFSRSLPEFISLHGALCANHPQLVVPALPIPATSAPSEEEEDRVLRNSFQRWVDRLTERPEIACDEELRAFLESSFGYAPTTIRRRLKASTSYKLPLSKTKSIEDEDGLGAIRSETARIETIFGDVARALDKAGQSRRAFSNSLSDLADQLSAFATTEAHPPLAAGLRRVGEGVKRLAEVNAGLANAELVTLADALVYSAAEAKEAKDALQQRQLIVEEHRTASKTAITKKRHIEKLRASNSIKPERVDEALEEFEDAQRHEQNLAAKLKAISSELEPSMKQHTAEMHDDLFNALLHHSKAGLLYERQNLKDLTALRQSIRDIPAKSAHTAVYFHVQTKETPLPPTVTERPTHSRDSSVVSNGDAPTDNGSSFPARRAASEIDSGSQSTFVPPTHQKSATGTTNERINELARSVVLPTHNPPLPQNVDPLSAESMHRTSSSTSKSGKTAPVDEKRRVDAQMAASKLANAFF